MFMTSLKDQVQQYLAGSLPEEALALLEKTKPSAEELMKFYTDVTSPPPFCPSKLYH
jgi:hypothetical protein